MRNTHEIRNHFHPNIEKTKLRCDICNATYDIKVQVSNLKNHFSKYHKIEYQQILEKQKERNENIKKINYIQRKENSNFVTTQNNIQEIQPYNNKRYHTTIHDENENEYLTEEKTIEIIDKGQVIQTNNISVTNKEDKKIYNKKQKIDFINLNDITEFNINGIQFKTNGKCAIIFK